MKTIILLSVLLSIANAKFLELQYQVSNQTNYYVAQNESFLFQSNVVTISTRQFIGKSGDNDDRLKVCGFTLLF